MSQSDDLLQAMIHRKILAGDLPKENCRMTWYGPGTGGICFACERPIAADDVEVECDLPKGVRSASIGGATTSGRRSGLRLKESDVRGLAQVHPSRLEVRAGRSYRHARASGT
jgi:hypothetical protein